MILAGDEFGRTQKGNNNTYCQDNELSWLNWDLKEEKSSLVRFVQKLTRMRHKYSILHHNRFLTGEYNEDLNLKDVTWIRTDGLEMESNDWDNPDIKCFGMIMDGRAPVSGLRRPGKEITILIILNAHEEAVTFTLPDSSGGVQWRRVIDTNLPDDESEPLFNIGTPYEVAGRTLGMFALKGEDNKE
jgi:glycogen operon protein